MLKIGLTGNIASGKSAVEDILTKVGYDVLDSDKVCHAILDTEPEFVELFKNYDVFENGKISRDKLGKIIFYDKELKLSLENLLYPKLRVRINEFFAAEHSEHIVFVAVPLVFEAEMTDLFDKILFIACDDELRLKRLINRNDYSEEYARVRMASQMPQDEKIQKSDMVIFNDSTLEDLEHRIMFLLEQIR